MVIIVLYMLRLIIFYFILEWFNDFIMELLIIDMKLLVYVIGIGGVLKIGCVCEVWN